MSAQKQKLEKLVERQRKIEAEIERIKAAETQQERKRDARRKILVGSMVLRLIERGEWPKEKILEKLEGYLTREQDRALFGLAPKEEAAGGQQGKVVRVRSA